MLPCGTRTSCWMRLIVISRTFTSVAYPRSTWCPLYHPKRRFSTLGNATSSRVRLDEHCVQQNPKFSKNVVQRWILAGQVLVNGTVVLKPGSKVSKDAAIEILAEEPKYVCRAGVKLEAALAGFNVSVMGKTVLDAGLSTGGFTDCLLQNGASKVYGVDVGTQQVVPKIARDSRVVVMEKTNLRNLQAEQLGCQVDVVTLDLSFISVLKVLPAVCRVLRPGGELLVLIKPQFEAGPEHVSSNGLVRDAQVQQAVLERVTSGIQAFGFTCHGTMISPIQGEKAGNTEFLAHFTQQLTALPNSE